MHQQCHRGRRGQAKSVQGRYEMPGLRGILTAVQK